MNILIIIHKFLILLDILKKMKIYLIGNVKHLKEINVHLFKHLWKVQHIKDF